MLRRNGKQFFEVYKITIIINIPVQIRKPFNAKGNSYLPHSGQHPSSLSISTTINPILARRRGSKCIGTQIAESWSPGNKIVCGRMPPPMDMTAMKLNKNRPECTTERSGCCYAPQGSTKHEKASLAKKMAYLQKLMYGTFSLFLKAHLVTIVALSTRDTTNLFTMGRGRLTCVPR